MIRSTTPLPLQVSSVTPITFLTFHVVLHRLSVFGRTSLRTLMRTTGTEPFTAKYPGVWTWETVSCSMAAQQCTHTREQPEQNDNLPMRHQRRTISGPQSPPHAHSCSVELDSDPTTVAKLFCTLVLKPLHFFLNCFCDSCSEEKLFWDIPRLKLHSKGLL